tara:strand:- start:889 stop:1107 length:219 start_codon:yes stop_codon:yes gene_type:complete
MKILLSIATLLVMAYIVTPEAQIKSLYMDYTVEKITEGGEFSRPCTKEVATFEDGTKYQGPCVAHGGTYTLG